MADNDEVKVKIFAEIVKSFVDQLKSYISASTGQDGMYAIAKSSMAEIESIIGEDISAISEMAEKYYEKVEKSVNTNNLQNYLKSLNKDLESIEKEYSSWYSTCLKDINNICNDVTLTALQAKETLNTIKDDEKKLLEQLKQNSNKKQSIYNHFTQYADAYFYCYDGLTSYPDRSYAEKYSRFSQVTACGSYVKKAKEDFKRFITEYIKLTSDDVTDGSGMFSEEGSINLDKLYTEGFKFSEDDLNCIDKTKGLVYLPFGSVTTTINKDSKNDLIFNVREGETEKTYKISDIKKLNLIEKIKVYFGLYILMHTELKRINKNKEIFNTLISFKNNANSLQYKIDYIQEVYNQTKLGEGQTIESYIEQNWTEIFNKTVDAGYWKNISEDELLDFSEYLKLAVVNIANGELKDLAESEKKEQVPKNATFFKKRNKNYIVDLDCMDLFKLNGALLTKNTINTKIVSTNVKEIGEIGGIYNMNRLKSIIVNGAWNGKYSLIISQGANKTYASTLKTDTKDNLREQYKKYINIAFATA